MYHLDTVRGTVWHRRMPGGAAMAYLISPLPLLFQAGDRMTREEFLERWNAYRNRRMPSGSTESCTCPRPCPSSMAGSLPAFIVMLGYYAVRTPGCECLANTTPDPDGIFRSKIFPRLWLDGGAFWREDASALLEVLERGLA